MQIAGLTVKKHVWVLLAVVLAFGFGFRLQAALHPNVMFSSADEVAYSRLASDVVTGKWFDGTPTKNRDYKGASPFHWSPGVPLVFGGVAYLAGDLGPSSNFTDTPSTYWLQMILSTSMILLVFLLACALSRKPWVGVCAAAAVACYPPYVLFASEMLSETLGSFSLLAGITALQFGLSKKSRGLFFLAGVMMAITVLARPNYLFLSAILLILSFVVAPWLRSLRTAAVLGLSYLVGFLLLLAPWTIFVSTTADRFIPVSTGSGASLFVGTYLPGRGNVNEMSKYFVPEIKKRFPGIAVEYDPRVGLRENKLRESRRRRFTFEVVAARHPGIDSDTALRIEAQKNLIHYSTTQPFTFAKFVLKKQRYLWVSYARGSGYKFVNNIHYYHLLLILLAWFGALYGLCVKRNRYLILPVMCPAYASVMHSLFLAQGRYALPTVAVLVAAGSAGIAEFLSDLYEKKKQWSTKSQQVVT